jgi:glycosyltransferase involved in cell wall biosynthesis
MLRGLFITADAGIYGSARSLQLLLRNYDNVKIDLLVPKLPFRTIDINIIRKRFGGRVDNIYSMVLPIDPCFVGAREFSFLKDRLIKFIKSIYWNIALVRIKKLVKKERYDFVHINSLSLNRIITDDYLCIVHVRELFNRRDKNVINRLRKAKGVIFIDDVVKEPFYNLPMKLIILDNPYDMRVNSSDLKLSGKMEFIFNNKDKNVFFLMIGTINEEKGVDLVIRGFRKLSNSSVRLLIVGSGNDYKYAKKCKDLSKNDKRIIFYGEEKNFLEIKKIYFFSDYVVRGDSVSRTGRTIMEGLFSGCSNSRSEPDFGGVFTSSG